MRKAFLSFCLLYAFVCQAQDYRLIDPSRINYYKYSDKIHSVRIDSVQISGSDTLLDNYKIWEYEFPWDGCINHNDTNFFLDRIIIKTNGDYIIYNENEDTLLIKPRSNLNSQWILYRYPNGDKLNATVISVSSGTYFGIPDSIKTIVLQAVNSIGNPIANPFNGKKIKIGRNTGLIQFFKTLDFPADTTSFVLQGKSNPQIGTVGLTYSDIKNWDVGDIFHYSGSWNNGSGDAMYNYELITITGKNISTTGDTVVYTKERKYYQKYINPWPNVQVTYNQNSVQETVIGSAPNNLNNLSYESYIDTIGFEPSGYNYEYENPSFPGKRMIKDFPQFYHFDSCFAIPTGQCISYEYDYLEGIGLFIEDHGGGPFCYVKNLVYYSKGSETWGTPINWETLLNVESSVSKNEFAVFPNPSKGKISVSFTSDIYRLDISDILGKVIYQSSGNGNSTHEIDLSAQPRGIYFLKITDENENQSVSKLIKE